MKIYIAGKITGDSTYQQKFMRARKLLEKRGYVVISPAVLPGGMTPGDYMKICFAMIDVADAVVFLPDWKDSAGARLEKEYCNYINKKILYQQDSLSENGKRRTIWVNRESLE